MRGVATPADAPHRPRGVERRQRTADDYFQDRHAVFLPHSLRFRDERLQIELDCHASLDASDGAARRALGVKSHPLEAPMHRARFLVLVAVALSSMSILGQAPAVTVFEGARIIVGDGRAADAGVPAGAARVNLAGKTVMPTIIDTHTHLSQTRPMLINDLKRRAYYGVGAALSLGQDTTDASFQLRAETAAGKIPHAARFFTAGRGITGPEPGRTMAPHWVTTVAEARQAVREAAD